MSRVAQSIAEEIHGVFSLGFEHRLLPQQFSDLACRVFAFQYEANLPYREYCMRRRVQPSSVKSYHDIPAAPASAFKEIPLACFPLKDAVNYFRTSGTTEGRHGMHYLREYSLYENSLKKSFSHFVMPDFGKLEMLILSVPPALEPHSSLIHMFDVVRKSLGDELSTWYMDENGILFDSFKARLRIIEMEEKAVCLLGTSLAFGYFCGWCEEKHIAFRLAGGSRLMDTGGSKGKRSGIPTGELTEKYRKIFGIPEYAIINEYGMTELFSQYYDNSFLSMQSVGSYSVGIKEGPPWLRTVAVDLSTGKPLPDGEPGLLRHYDLANVESVMAIQTEDIGIVRGNCLTLIGRDYLARPRGCSLLIEELTQKL